MPIVNLVLSWRCPLLSATTIIVFNSVNFGSCGKSDWLGSVSSFCLLLTVIEYTHRLSTKPYFSSCCSSMNKYFPSLVTHGDFCYDETRCPNYASNGFTQIISLYRSIRRNISKYVTSPHNVNYFCLFSVFTLGLVLESWCCLRTLIVYAVNFSMIISALYVFELLGYLVIPLLLLYKLLISGINILASISNNPELSLTESFMEPEHLALAVATKELRIDAGQLSKSSSIESLDAPPDLNDRHFTHDSDDSILLSDSNILSPTMSEESDDDRQFAPAGRHLETVDCDEEHPILQTRSDRLAYQNSEENFAAETIDASGDYQSSQYVQAIGATVFAAVKTLGSAAISAAATAAASQHLIPPQDSYSDHNETLEDTVPLPASDEESSAKSSVLGGEEYDMVSDSEEQNTLPTDDQVDSQGPYVVYYQTRAATRAARNQRV